MAELTPMLRQYKEIKAQYSDSILFFRLGDFYEMFFDDARIASRILGIALTSRGSHNGEKVPMCGVPYHAARSYIGKLINSGFKVAICEQVEDPKKSRGIVKREVTRVVTPGSVIDEAEVDEKSNLYVAAIFSGKNQGDVYGLSFMDLSTGDFRFTEVLSREELINELARIDPAELLVLHNDPLINASFMDKYRKELIHDPMELETAESLLKKQFGVYSLQGFGCHEMPCATMAAGIIIHYMRNTQKGFPAHIKEIRPYRIGEYMFLDEATCSHLELLRSMRRNDSHGSLFYTLNRTLTPMGSRTLKRWIMYPLISLKKIKKRLSAVQELKDNLIMRKKLRNILKDIYDIERLNGKISLGRANPKDLIALKESIKNIPYVKDVLGNSTSLFVLDLIKQLDDLQDIRETIEMAINEDPPVSLKDGGIIKEGYNDKLDELIRISRDGKGWIAEFVSREQKRTGINNLKVGFNKVFGYYIEVSRSNLHLVPQDYIRKQTLVNGERFITNELKEMEDKVLMAEERRRELEYSLFQEVIERIAKESERIKRASEIIGIIDTLCALAQVAEENDYLCPEVNDGNEIDIRDGRHPVVEKTIKDEEFVPNDIRIDLEEQQVLLITGPNMAGKSTILRQTALIVLMAQIGSFVPASRAKIGLVDRIFTRIGASDDLSRGQSTFMIEMTETANILRNATHRSLAILDEIGRGTSTYDGISIAWAVAEYLHDKRVRTLFATHYHELTELALIKPRIRNFNVGVKESGDRIIFIRKLLAGATNRSYGIHVAKIAGLPDEVIEKAEEILSGIESRSPRRKGSIVLNSYLRKKEKKENKEHSNLYNQLFLFPTK